MFIVKGKRARVWSGRCHDSCVDYRGEGQKPEARALSKQIADKLNQMNTKIAKILTKNSIPQTLEGKMDKVVTKCGPNINIICSSTG